MRRVEGAGGLLMPTIDCQEKGVGAFYSREKLDWNKGRIYVCAKISVFC